MFLLFTSCRHRPHSRMYTLLGPYWLTSCINSPAPGTKKRCNDLSSISQLLGYCQSFKRDISQLSILTFYKNKYFFTHVIFPLIVPIRPLLLHYDAEKQVHEPVVRCLLPISSCLFLFRQILILKGKFERLSHLQINPDPPAKKRSRGFFFAFIIPGREG